MTHFLSEIPKANQGDIKLVSHKLWQSLSIVVTRAVLAETRE